MDEKYAPMLIRYIGELHGTNINIDTPSPLYTHANDHDHENMRGLVNHPKVVLREIEF